MLIILYTLSGIIQKADFYLKSAFYNPKTFILLGFKLGNLAERGGFEPPKGFDTFTGLANQRTRPLCDLSVLRFHSI